MHVYICSSCGVSAHPFVYQGQGFYFTLRCAHEHTTFDENRRRPVEKVGAAVSAIARETLCVAKAKAKSPYLRQTDRQNDMVSYTTRRNGIHYAMPRCLGGPSHPDTNLKCTHCAAMMIRPYKSRDSARSALLTAVRSRRSGLAVHPRRVLHGPAAPDWRGEYAWGARAR